MAYSSESDSRASAPPSPTPPTHPHAQTLPPHPPIYRDRRYEYKGLTKEWKGKLEDAKVGGVGWGGGAVCTLEHVGGRGRGGLPRAAAVAAACPAHTVRDPSPLPHPTLAHPAPPTHPTLAHPAPPPLAQASADKGEVQEAKDMCVLYDSLQVCLWCVCVCLC